MASFLCSLTPDSPSSHPIMEGRLHYWGTCLTSQLMLQFGMLLNS